MQTAEMVHSAAAVLAPRAALSFAAAAQVSTTTGDVPAAQGAFAEWFTGQPQRAFAGALDAADYSMWSQSVGAGDGFAYAHITGFRCGPIVVPRLTVTCVNEHHAVQISGGFPGRSLYPGLRLELAELLVEVGVVTTHPDRSTSVEGLVITGPGGNRLSIALAHTDSLLTSVPSTHEGRAL